MKLYSARSRVRDLAHPRRTDLVPTAHGTPRRRRHTFTMPKRFPSSEWNVPPDEWVLVEEVLCEDGDNDRAIRDFGARHPEMTAQPNRLRTEILCHRDSGDSTVRFLWHTLEPPARVGRKPRHD